MSRYPATLSQHGPLRSLEQVLAEMVECFDAMPLTDLRRSALLARIRALESEIDVRQSL